MTSNSLTLAGRWAGFCLLSLGAGIADTQANSNVGHELTRQGGVEYRESDIRTSQRQRAEH